MSEYIKNLKEDMRKKGLLADYFNSNCNDNAVIYNVDFKKKPTNNNPEICIRYTTEFSVSEDEFNELIKKLES